MSQKETNPISDPNIHQRLTSLESKLGLNGIQGTIEERLARLEQIIGESKSENILRTDKVEVVAGTGNAKLSKKIGKELGLIVGEPIVVFASGELTSRLPNSCRDKHVYTLQFPSPPHMNDQIIEMYSMIGAARRSFADKITAVWGTYPTDRQERRTGGRESIDPADEARILEMLGVTNTMFMDIHADAEEGFFHGPVDKLFGSTLLLNKVIDDGYDDMVIVAADAGAARRSDKISSLMPQELLTYKDFRIAEIHKVRDPLIPNKSKAVSIKGDVAGHVAVLPEDKIDTGGSIVEASYLLKQNGAKQVVVLGTHGFFSDQPAKNKYALDAISEAPIDKIIVTDTVEHREAVLNHPKIEVVSTARYYAEAIKRNHIPGLKMADLIPLNSDDLLRLKYLIEA